MDLRGHAGAQDWLGIDDLLDFSNGKLFSDSAAAADSTGSPPPPETTPSAAVRCCSPSNLNSSADDFCVPDDDAAELEWLSHFADDSITDYPLPEFPPGAVKVRPESVFHGRSRSKRTRAASTHTAWTAPTQSASPAGAGNPKKKEKSLKAVAGGTPPSRRCAHCASEKTPQWRAGPLGPKTLCNACGVRFKSGRLVPEYRPAASPTFLPAQHSNSHRKVVELRRQKQILRPGREQSDHRCHESFEVS